MAQTVILRKEQGRMIFDKELSYVFSLLKNGTYSIEIKSTKERRTVSQNALMWMWFACIERETGTPKQDVHDYYCRQFLRRQITWNDETIMVIGETKKLNTQQMTEFLNKVQADVATEFGITLPRPEDRFFNDFYSQFNY
jgi:hypothetical protein